MRQSVINRCFIKTLIFWSLRLAESVAVVGILFAAAHIAPTHFAATQIAATQIAATQIAATQNVSADSSSYGRRGIHNLLTNVWLPGGESQVTWVNLGDTGSTASLRGLCATDDQVLWSCGANGVVVRSRDGGKHWQKCGPLQFQSLEFRSIHAWDQDNACIASAGTPAVILKTTNGGKDWRLVYTCDAAAAFINALRFYDGTHGLAFGDPIDGRTLIVESHDGGDSWQPIDSDSIPQANESEAGFAASNSALSCERSGWALIGTGGTQAESCRIYLRSKDQTAWQTTLCPLISGPSKGIFSITSLQTDVSQTERDSSGTLAKFVAVGGDYMPGAVSRTTAAYSLDGLTWKLATTQPPGFRSAVISLPKPIPTSQGQDSNNWRLLATGPTGTDMSADGIVWQNVSNGGFHALSSGRTRVFACGANGKVSVLQIRSMTDTP
ncbi:MAG: hypothetical protein KDB22_02740 [Planctomycetales bacterium]|nr:hypothetical protein [Planctomycetales bacterium]